MTLNVIFRNTTRRDDLISDTTLLVSFILSIGALFFVGISESSLLATLAIWLLWGSFGTLCLAFEKERSALSIKPFMRMFWVTFSLRIFVMAVLHVALSSTVQWPWWDFGAYGGDEFGFWVNSERLVLAWQNGTILSEAPLQFDNYFMWLEIIGFNRFIGSILGGETVYNTRLVICMAGALIVPYIYAITKQLFDERAARIAAILAFWLPDYWFFSSTLMRSVLISFVMLIIYYQVVSFVYNGFRLWRFIFAIGLNFLVLRFLRADLAFINVAIVGLWLIWSKLPKNIILIHRLLLTAVLALGTFTVLSTSFPEIYSLQALHSSRYFHETRFTGIRFLALEEAGTGSFGLILVSFPILLRWPLTTLFLLLQPVPPWTPLQGGTGMFPLKAGITTVAATVWYGMAAFLPVGFMGCFGNQPRKTVWVWGTALVLAAALGFASAAGVRWRLAVTPFLLIVIAEGITCMRQHPHLLRLSIASLVGALVLYSVLKYGV